MGAPRTIGHWQSTRSTALASLISLTLLGFLTAANASGETLRIERVQVARYPSVAIDPLGRSADDLNETLFPPAGATFLEIAFDLGADWSATTAASVRVDPKGARIVIAGGDPLKPIGRWNAGRLISLVAITLRRPSKFSAEARPQRVRLLFAAPLGASVERFVLGTATYPLEIAIASVTERVVDPPPAVRFRVAGVTVHDSVIRPGQKDRLPSILSNPSGVLWEVTVEHWAAEDGELAPMQPGALRLRARKRTWRAIGMLPRLSPSGMKFLRTGGRSAEHPQKTRLLFAAPKDLRHAELLYGGLPVAEVRLAEDDTEPARSK